MIYFTGKMSEIEGMTLIAMIIIPNMYLSETSVTIGAAGSSAWILKIISGLIVTGLLLGILYYYEDYINKVNNGKVINFYQFVQGLMGKKYAVIMTILWAVMFEVETILTLREFTDYTLITTLPTTNFKVIIILFAVVVMCLLYQGLEVILRTAYLFFLITIVGILLTLIALYDVYEVSNLFPWQGYGLESLAKKSIADIGSWLGASAILFIAPYLQNVRTIRRSILYGLGYTIFLKVGFYLAVVMVFGSIFAPERILLFYEAIQTIHLSAYLQRVDTAFVIMWLTGGLISAIILQFLSLTLLCDPFKIKDIRPMIPIIVLISATFSLMPDSVVSTIEINNTFVYYVSTTFICLNFFFTSIGYYRFRRNKLCAGVTK